MGRDHVLGRTGRHCDGQPHLDIVDGLSGSAGRHPRGGCRTRHRRRRRRTVVGGRTPLLRAAPPTSGSHLLFALSVALADPDHRHATPRRDHLARLGQRGTTAHRRRGGDRHLSAGREPDPALEVLDRTANHDIVLGACLVGATVLTATYEIRQPTPTLATPGIATLSTGDRCPAPTSHQIASWRGSAAAPRHVSARVLLIGDSTACTMLPGLTAVAAPAGVEVEDAAVIGCGIVSGEIAPRIVNGSNVNSASASCQSRSRRRAETRSAIGPSQCRLVGQHLGARAACRRERRRTEDPEAGIARVVGRTSGTHSRPRARVHRNGCHRHHVDASALFSEAEPGWATVSKTRATAPRFAFGGIRRPQARRAHDRSHAACLPIGAAVPASGRRHLGAWRRGAFTIEGSIWVARWLAPQIGVGASVR